MKPIWIALVALAFALGYYALNRAVILHYNHLASGSTLTWGAQPISKPSSWWIAQNRFTDSTVVAGHTVAVGLNGNATITFPDDEYYITPAENWLAGRGWRRSPGVGHGSLVRRTPGYSLWYLAHRVVFGPKYVFGALAVTQLLLHVLSALALWCSLVYLRIRSWLVTTLVLLFTVTPFFNSYTFYSITESLAVPVLIFMMYCLLRGYYASTPIAKRNAYLAAGLLWGIALLTRPFTGLCLVSIVWVLYYDYVRQAHSWGLFLRRGMQLAIAPMLMIGAWTVRNYVATGGSVVVLERYSHPETFDVFRPSFNSMFTLYLSAGVSQGDFYAFSQPLFSDVTRSGTAHPEMVERIVRTMPMAYRQAMGEARLRNAVNQYQELLVKEYHPYVLQDRPMPPTYSPAEMAVVDTFRRLNHRLLAAQPLLYLTGPLSVVKEAVFNSNTGSMYAFQAPFRDAFPLINLPRYLFLLLHVAIYATLFLGLLWLVFRKKRPTRLGPWPVALAAPSLLLILFLSLSVMTTEQRYQLVFLEYLVLFAGLILEELLQRVSASRLE